MAIPTARPSSAQPAAESVVTASADELRSLLTAVAEGRVSPAEAAAQIGEPEPTDTPAADIGGASPGASAPAADGGESTVSPPGQALDEELAFQGPGSASAEAPRSDERDQDASEDDRVDDEAESGAAPTVERLSLEVAYRNVRVIGDAKVSGVTVEGPHERHIDGTMVRIDAADPPIGGEPALFDESRGWRGWRNWRRLADETRLVIRVRPDLPIEFHAMASSVAIVRCEGELRGEAESSAVRADVLKHPFDLSIRAGTIRLRAALTAGESRVHGDASAVNVTIDPASDLRVALHGSMSSLSVPPDLRGRPTRGPGSRGRRRKVLDERYEMTTGAGAALLTIDANMSAVRLHDDGHGSSRGAATGRQRGGRPTPPRDAAARGPRGARASRGGWADR